MPKTQSPDELWAKSAYHVDNPLATVASSFTVTPDPGEYVHVDWLVMSYNDNPTSGARTVTIKFGGVEKFRWRPGVVATVQGPQFIGPFVGEIDEALLFEADAPGGAGDFVSLAIKYRKNATIS